MRFFYFHKWFILIDETFPGNDLARVLRWGSGYNGNGNILSLLRGVIDAEEIRLDRWTVMLYPEESQEPPSTSNSGGKLLKI